MPATRRFLTIPLFLALCCGCAPVPPPLTLSDAEKKLVEILQNEFQYKAAVRPSGKTVWVYIPGERELFAYKAGEASDTPPVKKFSVEYLKGAFDNDYFVIDYDIIPAVKSSDNTGLSSGYTEAFNKEYVNTLGAVTQTYLNTETPPDFIGIIFADIKTGLEMVNIFSVDDFKQYQTSALPYEEYQLRVINETKGNKKIIGDWEGKHFDFPEILLPDFLAKQIINRINFKYQKSDFAPGPGADTAKEIAKIVFTTVSYYHFTDFIGVKLNDLRSGSSRVLEQWELLKITK